MIIIVKPTTFMRCLKNKLPFIWYSRPGCFKSISNTALQVVDTLCLYRPFIHNNILFQRNFSTFNLKARKPVHFLST